MKIEINSKITVKWWQLALIIVLTILALRDPGFVGRLVQAYVSSHYESSPPSEGSLQEPH